MYLRTALPTAVTFGVLFGLVLVAVEGPEPTRDGAAPVTTTIVELTQVPVAWDLPVVWNSSVARFVSLFSGEQQDRMALYLKRSGRYEGMIRAKLRANGLPEDLLYLSMIESGFNPNALSRARAVGLWQFMSGTARDYGLRVDSYVDERRDPERSTDAAIRYLQDLYERFGSWNLAAAAYNAGEGRVGRVLRSSTGGARGSEADFWRIRDRLPSDTREYVPLIFAAAMVGKEPHRYGLGDVQRWLPIPTDTVMVPGGTDLSRVAAAIEIDRETVRALNPHLIRGMTPPGNDYPVRIPDGRAAIWQIEPR